MKEELPKYHEQMLPLLGLYANGLPLKLDDLEKPLAKVMGLSDDLLEVRYEQENPKSRTVFLDRMGWARTYLAKAKLLDRVATNTYIITDRGKQLLEDKPDKLTSKVLREKYPDFWDEHTTKKARIKHGEIEEIEENTTPEELITSSIQSLREAVSLELREKLHTMSPRQFEFLVVELLEKMGYGVGEATRYSKDGGIDGLVRGDYLGFEMIYVQAKRWAGNVGRKEVSQFVGDILTKGARKGIFITTSGFNKDALEASNINNLQLILVDGDKLVEHMINFGLGVSVAQSHNVYKIDIDYFEN